MLCHGARAAPSRCCSSMEITLADPDLQGGTEPAQVTAQTPKSALCVVSPTRGQEVRARLSPSLLPHRQGRGLGGQGSRAQGCWEPGLALTCR